MPMFFPEARDIPEPTREDLAACRAMLRCGSRSFFAASLLLPRKVHEPATALYAFCRHADDAIDCLCDSGGERISALAGLAERLDLAYAGRPMPHPADRAFAAIVAAKSMPRALPEALLEGFAWDAEGRTYETPAALYDYAARVAGSVGAMMAVLMGVRSASALARACDLGMAMQLTNIARDVGEDARAGRLYLPLAWLREAGIDPAAFLAEPAFTPALGGVIRRLIGCSERLYARGMPGIADLPLACRPGIRAAGLLYAGIGQEVARMGHDSVTERARVSASRKAGLLARSVAATLAQPAAPVAPLPAARGLVDASAVPPQQRRPRKPIGEQLIWLLDLFERLQDSPLREPDAVGGG
jgi:phytoene synthase